MSTHEHATPGPWQVNIVPGVLGRDFVAAIWDAEHCRIACIDRRPRLKTHEELANARLVAAAPELAQVVARLHAFTIDAADAETLGYLLRDHGVLDDAARAIARVRGEEPTTIEETN